MQPCSASFDLEAPLESPNPRNFTERYKASPSYLGLPVNYSTLNHSTGLTMHRALRYRACYYCTLTHPLRLIRFAYAVCSSLLYGYRFLQTLLLPATPLLVNRQAYFPAPSPSLFSSLATNGVPCQVVIGC